MQLNNISMATPTQSQLGLTIAAFTNELLEIQAQVQNFAKMPIKEVSKVRLSSLSSLLRELSKQLPRFPPPQVFASSTLEIFLTPFVDQRRKKNSIRNA